MRFIHHPPVTVKTHPKRTNRKRAREITNVSRDAALLGVRREHLSRVLHLAVSSRLLTARYRQLKGLPLSRPQALLISEYQRRLAEKAVTAQRTTAPTP